MNNKFFPHSKYIQIILEITRNVYKNIVTDLWKAKRVQQAL